MRKLFLVFLVLFMIIGCNDNLNNPKVKVKEFFDKYQKLDNEVLMDLEYIIESKNLNETEKNLYRENMRRQYKNLKYKIKNEEINDDNASIIVEIEVYDYGKAIKKASEYFIKNQDFFINENNMVDESKYIDYKLNEMKKTNDKIKYDIEFSFYKKNKIWSMNAIKETDIEKIHGIYNF